MQRLPISVSTSLGELLKYLRRRARLSQRELSIAVGYSESHISRLESNHRALDRASLLALFVPALHLQQEPAIVEQLLALCTARALPAAVEPLAPAGPRPLASARPLVPSRLPAQLTSFVGRKEEMVEVCDLLRTQEVRLLTLTGAGGCGKTRLALRVGEKLADAYVHGAWLVELASLADPQLLIKTVAAAFELDERADEQLLATLTDFLQPCEALLILDNCEHLVDAAAQLAGALLRACPQLQILSHQPRNPGCSW